MELYRTGGYTLNREYDIRGIMVPRIGDLLYYDKADMQVVILEYDDTRYYVDRYLPIGIIIDITNDRKTLHLLTPYFIETEIDFTERISEKNIIKLLKSFVKTYTKSLFENDLDDLKINMTTTNDLNSIIDKHEYIIPSLTQLSENYSLFSHTNLSNILLNNILIYVDDKKLLFTYGLLDNFSEEFKTLKINKNNVLFNNVKTLKEFKDMCDTDIIKGYIIPMAKITLD